MRTLLLTICLIVGVVLLFIASASAQNHDGVIGQEPNIFPRMFQKNMMCSKSDFVRQDLKERLQTVKVWWGIDNTGRWLFMLSFPDNVTCGLVGGEMSVPYDKNPYFK